MSGRTDSRVATGNKVQSPRFEVRDSERLFVNNVGPAWDDGEVAFDGGVFGDAKFAVEPVGGGVEADRVAGLETEPSARPFDADDRRFG